MIMAGKWMVFDGAFNDDGASTSSSPFWMIGVVDSIVGDSKMAFVRKVSLGNEHGVYVAQRKEGFQFFFVLMKAIGVPERKLKECSHYVSLVRTVVKRFIMVPICSKRLFISALRSRSEISLNC
jgi:hypothetical protein